MAKLSPAKIGIFVLVAIVGVAAASGYFSQASKLSDEPTKEEKIEQTLLTPKPNDLILGDINAIVTIVEYSSLSCPHCAHFHDKVLPDLEKEFIETGKVKLIVRHFPLNDAALKAAQIVECASTLGLKREDFLRAFFKMQQQWAFDDNYIKSLKQIALVGGMDSAAFDSCSNDKEIENRIVTMRMDGASKLHVNSTPSFFVNGMKLEAEPTIDGFRDAIAKAAGGTQE